MFETDVRELMKANNVEDLKAVVFREVIKIDDPIDIYSKHTMLHDSVIMGKMVIPMPFPFCLSPSANPAFRLCIAVIVPMARYLKPYVLIYVIDTVMGHKNQSSFFSSSEIKTLIKQSL